MRINIPTRITLIRVAAIPLLMWMIQLSPDRQIFAILALLIFIGGSLTDWLDGYLARKNDDITTLGKFFDQLADKAFIAGALCVLVWNHEVSFWLLAIIIIRDTAVSGIRMLAASNNEVIPANIWGKTKTVAQMVYVSAVLINVAFNWPAQWLRLGFAWIVAILTVVSGITYFKGFSRYL